MVWLNNRDSAYNHKIWLVGYFQPQKYGRECCVPFISVCCITLEAFTHSIAISTFYLQDNHVNIPFDDKQRTYPGQWCCRNHACWIDWVDEDSSPYGPGTLFWYRITLILAWENNYIYYKVWDEITYPFVNFNGYTVEIL